jgi:hypothetical protein
MPIRLIANPYRGVNAHLHSLAQNPERSASIWTSFHASHIGHITDALNALLPPHYVARSEQSLQIWTEDLDLGEGISLRPRPDTSVFLSGTPMSGQSASSGAISDPSVRVVSHTEWFQQEESFFAAVMIYPVEAYEFVGQPVTRIELLSESNKRGGAGFVGYQRNRLTALRSGTSLIEVDYLHESPSPLPGVADYPTEPDSHPYLLAVTDRRPGKNPDAYMLVYGFDVDTPIPARVILPLAGEDTVAVDFNAIYQHTFIAGRWGVHLDYEQFPKNFDRYSPADQERIRQVMAQAKTAG